MRKLLSIVLILSLLIPFAGCADSGKDILFYYPRKQVLYGQADGVISAEERDVPGREQDLQYLLLLYLEGPLSQELYTPFPKGTTIKQFEIQEKALRLVLSDDFEQLEGLDYTIACTCIAQTCFGLGSFDTVEVTFGSNTMILTPRTMALVDNSASNNPT